jgi:guanine deaminase
MVRKGEEPRAILILSLVAHGVRKKEVPGQPNPDLLRRVIAQATENVLAAKGGPFAAAIVRDGKIVGEGANCVTTTNDPTAHAEVSAIRAAAKALGSFTLAGCELYTSCEPCPMCLSAAYWARIDAVYYGASAADAARAGFDDAFLYAEFRKDRADRKLRATQLISDEAWASFAAWIASPHKVLY